MCVFSQFFWMWMAIRPTLLLGVRAAALVVFATTLSLTALAWFTVSSSALYEDTCSAEAYLAVDEIDNSRWLMWWATGSTDMPSTCQLGTNPLPSQCPLGCNCTSTYSTDALALNMCLDNTHRHSACRLHMDCEGLLPSALSADPLAFVVVTNDEAPISSSPGDFSAARGGAFQRCSFLSRDSFLASCAAMTEYADFRDARGAWFVLAFAIPCLVSGRVLLRVGNCLNNHQCHRTRVMATLRKPPQTTMFPHRMASSAIPVKQDAEGNGRQKIANAAKEGTSAAVESVATGSTLFEGTSAQVDSTEAATLSGLLSCFSSRFSVIAESRWFQLSVHILAEASELSSQIASFSNPTATDTVLPITHGSLICSGALAVPVLFVLKRETTLSITNLSISLGYAFISFRTLSRAFLSPIPDGQLPSFTTLPDDTLAIVLVSAVLPMVLAAQLIYRMWRRCSREPDLADGKDGKDEATAEASNPVPTVIYYVIECLYCIGSFACAYYVLQPLVGQVDCGRFRTCARPTCDPSAPLPFGLTSSDLPFYLPQSERLQVVTMTMLTQTGTEGAVWVWNQTVTLNLTAVVLTSTDDGIFLAMQLEEATGGGLVRRALFNSTQDYTVNASTPDGLRGSCTATFRIACQERIAGYAFADSMEDDNTFIEYDPSLHKLLLQEPYPTCWRSQIGEEGRSWWEDLLLFGPSSVVASSAEGERSLGLVVENTDCSATPQGVAQGAIRCIRLAPHVLLSGEYGRNPLMGNWHLTNAPADVVFPSSWSTVSLNFELAVREDEVQQGIGRQPPAGFGTPPSVQGQGPGSTPSGVVPPSSTSPSRSPPPPLPDHPPGLPPPPPDGLCVGGGGCAAYTSSFPCANAGCGWNPVGCFGGGACQTISDQASCQAASNCAWQDPFAG